MKSVTLLQYSDMIHFEALPKKNTILRISELKPRLTEFIKKDLKIADSVLYEEFNDIIENKKIFPEDKGSPYFKITTEPKFVKVYKYKTFKSKRDKNYVKVGSYFGDYYAVNFEKVQIKIYSRIKRLEELVEKALKSFLIINNLGQRQSKGFGSFVVDGTTKEEFEKILKNYFKIILKKSSNDSLKTVNQDYQLIKSGINFKEYKKSLLYRYFAKDNIIWEKKKIKQEIIKKHPKIWEKIKHGSKHIPRNEDKDVEYRFIRALLGLSYRYDFIKKQEYQDRKNKLNSISVEVNSKNKIERIPSPILFKVYKNDIYLVANEVEAIIFDKDFEFKLLDKYVKNNRIMEDEYELFDLTTPSSFDLFAFIKFAYEEELQELNWQRIK